jgi:FtsP/CotA-like multicopper oxidase with cupredoxin domain
MRVARKILVIILLWYLAVSATAQTRPCPERPGPGTEVFDPLALHSQNGVLSVDLTMRNMKDQGDTMRFCYTYQDTEAPTLRVNPGDQIVLNLANRLKGLGTQPLGHFHGNAGNDPCAGTMTPSSTNVHFHGLNVPSKCHQDEVLFTLINPADPPFRYRIRIPNNEPPGLYWYHPHPHGMTMLQIMGGASGAIIVEGIEKLKPEVIGLTERVFILRDQLLGIPGDLDASNMTINFQPSTYPATQAPVITMKPSERQFWRLLNAEGEVFLTLQFQIDGDAQDLEVIALDGTPLKTNLRTKTIAVPPAGRAEFIVQAPPAGVPATFVTLGVDTGPDGDPNPPHLIANVTANAGAVANRGAVAPGNDLNGPRRFAELAAQVPRVQRKLFFSEDVSDPDNPKFFITVDGETPKLFDPNDPPAVIAKQGTVEDWIIQNRSGEIHAFHMHQLHFLVLERNGRPITGSNVQDTVTVQPWDGQSPVYPSVKIRMDFRYPESVGTYVYHCHILDHEDGGMMAKIQVDPK